MFRGVRCGTIEMNNVLSLRAFGLACVGHRVETTGLAPTRRQGNRASILASDLGDPDTRYSSLYPPPTFHVYGDRCDFM